MKKAILLITSAFLAYSSFAGGNEAKSLKKKGEGVLSKGFYLNLGVGFPSPSSTTINYTGFSYTGTQSLGIQPNIEIGNQWYFWHNKTIGVGIKASWLQFGYSAAAAENLSFATNVSNYSNFDIRLLKVAPEFSVAINNDIAIDFTFEVSPTLVIGQVSYKDSNLKDNVVVNYNYGALLAPGARFRYKIFALGFDYGFGTLVTVNTSATDSKQNATYYGSSTYAIPRVYLGFQF